MILIFHHFIFQIPAAQLSGSLGTSQNYPAHTGDYLQGEAFSRILGLKFGNLVFEFFSFIRNQRFSS